MKRFLICALIVGLILGSECIFTNRTTTIQVQTPKINIIAKVNHLSQNEFERIGTKGIQNPKIDDFRNFSLKIEITNGRNVTKKDLIVPNNYMFKQILTSDLYWFGNEMYQNNDGQDLSLAERNFVLYYRELTDDKLKQLLGPLEFHIGWVNRNGDEISKYYRLGDYLIFDS